MLESNYRRNRLRYNKVIVSLLSYAKGSKFIIIIYLFCYLIIMKPYYVFAKPLIISSKVFTMDHVPRLAHYEIPERIEVCLKEIDALSDLIKYQLPSGETDLNRRKVALDIIHTVHNAEYITEVESLCKRGAKALSPWDSDTYISKNSFEVCLLAQSAWLDGIDEVLCNKNTAFAVTRPPGHHAMKDNSMGFCIFNFAVGAANYAISKGVQRIGILDFDVHYGNGVADLISSNPNIRYTSLHQYGIFPNEGSSEFKGNLDNILNVELPLNCNGTKYLELLVSKSIPFLKEFEPELLIVCAGFDALINDPLAEINLVPKDYYDITKKIKENFSIALFGLEGGYDLIQLPLALKETISVFL